MAMARRFDHREVIGPVHVRVVTEELGQFIVDEIGRSRDHAQQDGPGEILGSPEEERAESLVAGNQDTIEGVRGTQEVLVGCAAQARLRRGEDVMTEGTKERCRGVIDVLIDQEAHNDPSGSGDVDLFGLDEGCGIFHARLDVLHCEFRVVAFHNLLKRDPVLNEFKDTIHGNPSSLDARLAEMDPCIDNDSLARHRASSSELQVRSPF